VLFRSAAKASWGGALVKMGAKYTPKSSTLTGVARAMNWVVFRRQPPKQQIMVLNYLGYVAKIAPHVQSIALAKARNRLEHMERQTWNKGINTAWRVA
jgi:hypothetical protein